VKKYLLTVTVFSILFLLSVSGSAQTIQTITVGSKNFTENVILGELITYLARNAGAKVEHQRGLGGTQVLWNALLRGEIDIYPDYTGTISQEILAGSGVHTDDEIRQVLAEKGILMSKPLGFNNTFAIGMKKAVAQQYNIQRISDLKHHPNLKFGFTNEFMDREDGWKGLRNRYQLPQTYVRGLDHDLAYQGLSSDSIHVVTLFSTDAEIAYYDLQVLKDDLQYFPEYNAVILYRADLQKRMPQVVDTLLKLEGKISESEIVYMNARAKLDRIAENQVAADFLAEKFAVQAKVKQETLTSRLIKHTIEHLHLVGISLFAAVLLSIPLGIFAAKTKQPQIGQLILGIVGIIQTIPSLALLVFMVPFMGIGEAPAIMALFLYSLLPIVRNTYTGLHDIPPQIIESAKALGLPPLARLRLIELPLASRSIMAGIKTSAIINIGTATLGALIGAGGYGQPILTGIRLDDIELILQGAIPAAGLALVVQGMFELAEKVFIPKGLRLKSQT